MKSWVPGCLIQDDEDVAYQPTDKEGKKLAAKITLYFRLLAWRVKTAAPMHERPGEVRQSTRPIAPQE